MKKILSLAAAIILSTSMSFDGYLDTGSVLTAEAVDTEKVSVTLSELTEVTNGMITVTYDTEKLRLEKAKAGSVLASSLCTVRNTDGKTIIAFAASDVMSVEGSLLDLEFTRISGTEDISELCSFTVNEFISLDKEGKEYNVSTEQLKFVSDTKKSEAVVSVSGKIDEETSEPQVMLNISENTGVTNGIFTVKYDPEVIKFEKGTVCEAFKGTYAEINEVSAGVIKIAFVNNTGISAGGDMIKLDFSVVNDGTSALEVEVNEFSNVLMSGEVEKISTKTVGGSVTVSQSQKAEISITDAITNVSQKTDVFISIPVGTGVTNGVMTVEYDTKLAKFDSSEACDAFENTLVQVYEAEPGKIKIAFINSQGIMAGGNALKLSFTGVASGETTLTLSVSEFSNISLSGDVTKIPVKITNGKFVVKAEEVDYDVDGNGVVNALDLVYAKRSILHSESVTQDVYRRTDINKDGKVNVFDLIRLKQIMIEE